MKRFIFCPICKEKINKTIDFYKCEACGFIQYIHSYPTGSAFVIKDGMVLLAKRAREPHKGELDIGGGFCKYGEHPHETAIREIFEETSLKVKIWTFWEFTWTYIHTKGAQLKPLTLYM